MKRLFIYFVLMLATITSVFAQIPQTFSYQAIVRDTENKIVANKQVYVYIYILQGSDEGSEIYSENHVVTTNQNGLMTLELGGGKTAYDFSSIDWSKAPYFVKTVTNVDGKLITGITPLLAVPYALYAAKAGNVEIDLSDYAKKSDIPEAVDLSEYAKSADIESNYATKTDLNAYTTTIDLLSTYVEKSEMTRYCSKDQIYAMLENFFIKFGIDDGSIKGEFSISETQKVYFSKGNLQYRASSHSWRFAENQWDIIGEDNENISSSYSGWIDLFGYGTSGFNGKYPYTTSTNANSYPNSNIAGTNYDWGVYNVFNNAIGQWRTLTNQEWSYLLDRKSGQLYSIGTVNGVYGLILLPDEWDIQSSENFTPQADNWDTNNYSQDEWERMQSNGSVFLPVAGFRTGTEFKFYSDASNKNYYGYYWCSTTYPDHSDPIYYFSFSFTKKSKYITRPISIGYGRDCYYGRSVRLVRDAD